MTELVSLDDLKVQLRLDLDETGEDISLLRLLTAARRTCELKTNRLIADVDLDSSDLEIIKLAMLMLATNWYDNRDGETGEIIVRACPASVSGMLDLVRSVPAPAPVVAT